MSLNEYNIKKTVSKNCPCGNKLQHDSVGGKCHACNINGPRIAALRAASVKAPKSG